MPSKHSSENLHVKFHFEIQYQLSPTLGAKKKMI